MIMVTDELVWKEDIVEEENEEEGDWEECSDEDDAQEDDDGEEAPDLVDITSTKRVGKDAKKASEVGVASYFSSLIPMTRNRC